MTIILISIAVFAVIFFFLDAINDAECDCKHTHFARYESQKSKTCVDCGLKLPLNDNHLPKHQR